MSEVIKLAGMIGGVRFSLSYDGKWRRDRSESQSTSRSSDGNSREASSVHVSETPVIQDMELDTVSEMPSSVDLFGLNSIDETPLELVTPETPSAVDPQTRLISELVGLCVGCEIRSIR